VWYTATVKPNAWRFGHEHVVKTAFLVKVWEKSMEKAFYFLLKAKIT
jgi:hypothetical protein